MPHNFVITVESPGDKRHAELALLTCFAERQPDGCKFHLREAHTAQVTESVRAMLQRIADNPVVAWHVGEKSEEWKALTESLALLTGESVDKIRDAYKPKGI